MYHHFCRGQKCIHCNYSMLRRTPVLHSPSILIHVVYSAYAPIQKDSLTTGADRTTLSSDTFSGVLDPRGEHSSPARIQGLALSLKLAGISINFLNVFIIRIFSTYVMNVKGKHRYKQTYLSHNIIQKLPTKHTWQFEVPFYIANWFIGHQLNDQLHYRHPPTYVTCPMYKDVELIQWTL